MSVALYGVEDPALYIENLKAYRNSLEFKVEVDKCLNILAEAITKLRVKIYPKEFKELDNKMRLFREGRIGFEDYAASMAAYAQKKKIDFSEYPNIKLFYEAMDHENGINYKEAERERNILIDMLNKRLSRKYLEELAAKTVAFNDQVIQSGEYYAYLSDKAELCGIELDKFPNFKKYTECANKTKTVNKKALQKEFRALEERMCGLFLTTDAQKSLCSLDKRIFILQNLFSVSLVKEDWDYYIAHRDDFDTKNFLSLLPEKNNDSFSRLNDYREKMEKFYSLSLKRDDVFIDKIIAKLKREKQNNIILVTGGFHQDNLKKLFQDKGYSYIEVLPKINKEDGECPYFRLLSGGMDPITKAVSEKGSTLQIASYLSPMAKEIYAQIELTAFQLAVAIVKEIASQNRAIYIDIPGKGIVKFEIDAEPKLVGAIEGIQPRDLSSFTTKPIPRPGPGKMITEKFNMGGEVKFGTGEGEWQYVDAQGNPSAAQTDTIMRNTQDKNVKGVLAERLPDGTFVVTIGGTGPVSQQSQMPDAEKVEMDYQEKIYPLAQIEFNKLPPATRAMLLSVGISNEILYLAKAGGAKASLLFKFVISCTKDQATFDAKTGRTRFLRAGFIELFGAEFVVMHLKDIADLVRAAGPADAIICLLDLIESFGMDFIKKHWKDIIELGKAADEDAGELFARDLPELKKSFNMEFINTHWDDIVELGKGAGKSAGYLLGYGLNNTKDPFSTGFTNTEWTAIVRHTKELCLNTTDYNRGKIMPLIFKTYPLQIDGREVIPIIFETYTSDFLVHISFYNKVIKENKRIAYAVIEGIVDGIEEGIVDMDLNEKEQANILVFIEKTHSFDPLLYKLYKQKGSSALEPLKVFADKAYMDSIGDPFF